MKNATKALMLVIMVINYLTVSGQGITEKLTSKNVIGTGNNLFNAFDGKLETVFGTNQNSGGWVGLDLGEKYVIEKIAYCPLKSQSSKLQLGVFEGANNPDFGDALPLFIIKDVPPENMLTEQVVNCSKGFRYVRYVGPSGAYCNIAELEFYGYKGEGDNNKLFQLTNLPTVTIHTKDAAEIVSKDNYIKGIVTIISDNGTQLFTDSLEIKGRGNASWTFPKKPYKMKLYNKASLLKLPAKEKNWTLINNYGDKTLMRNLLAFDLSQRLDMSYTPAGKAVDVILNGEYKGTYQLCDQIEVAKQRIDIEKMATEDVSLPNLSGGYLLEIDAYANEGISWFVSTRTYTPVTIQYPKDDEIVPAQKSYITAYFNSMETALFSPDYKDNINGYSKYIDKGSFIRQFLVGEFSGNTDTYWSTYLYKKRNDDLFRFGPVWDFDIAYENDYRTYPINNNPEWVYASKGSAAGGARSIVNRLLSDSSLYADLKSVYATYRDHGILSESTLLNVVNDYAVELEQSQQLNFIRWNTLNSPVHMNPRTYGSYVAEVNNVKEYIKKRLVWMDKKLEYIPAVVASTDHRKNSKLWIQTDENSIQINNPVQPQQVDIVDVLGRTKFSKVLTDYTVINIEKGIYLIHVTSLSGESEVIKCMVP
ncbi:MAG: CotH kinase family protein [Sporocytophaga sp.]|uniref:CotH kinase family protein n=1 Tax=Sporocytophaga sp. TaxID=2231183 RepID=UPI001AFD0AD8|nr:CotH kinase family protein [Sporocytophaga sp.]MBO9700130.1 CotH kinase family protein [Sporocytophaga sp.]